MARKSRLISNKITFDKIVSDQSWRKKTKFLKKELKSKGLSKTPFTNFDENTKGGIFDIGLLKNRPIIESGHDETIVNEKAKPVFIEATIPNYSYFFITRENPSVRGDEDKQYSFYIVEAITPVSITDCAKQLGISESKIKPLDENSITTDYFYHPVYLNGTYGKVKIFYGEIPVLKQTEAGRMDNLPFGYPAFNYNPSPIVTNSPLPPSAPYTFFYAEGYTADDLTIMVDGNGVIQFLDKSPASPPQISPSEWIWTFAGVTGSTSQNPSYDFSLFPAGTYEVSLTASNTKGSRKYTREGYIVSTGEIYLDAIYSDVVLLGFGLQALSSADDEIIRVRRLIPDEEANFTAREIVDGTMLSWVGPGNDATVSRLLQQFSNGLVNVDLYPVGNEPLIVDSGNLVLDPAGKPSMYFDGTCRMECNITAFGSPLESPFTTFSVFTLDAPGGNDTIIADDGNFKVLWIEGASGGFSMENTSTDILDVPGERQIVHAIHSPIASIIGTKNETDYTLPGFTRSVTKLHIGHINGSDPLVGYLSEILVFNGNLNDIGATGPGESDLHVISNKINMRYE